MSESATELSRPVKQMLKEYGVAPEHLRLSSRRQGDASAAALPEKSMPEMLAHARAIASWEEQQRHRMLAEAALRKRLRAERDEARQMWATVVASMLVDRKRTQQQQHQQHDADGSAQPSGPLPAQILVALSNNDPDSNRLDVEQLSRVLKPSSSSSSAAAPAPASSVASGFSGSGPERARRFLYLWSRYGCPPESRRHVWLSRIGNKLGILPEAFDECVRASRDRANEAASAAGVGGGGDGGMKRAAHQQHRRIGSSVAAAKVDALTYIALDIPRTCIVSMFEQRDLHRQKRHEQQQQQQQQQQEQQKRLSEERDADDARSPPRSPSPPAAADAASLLTPTGPSLSVPPAAKTRPSLLQEEEEDGFLCAGNGKDANSAARLILQQQQQPRSATESPVPATGAVAVESSAAAAAASSDPSSPMTPSSQPAVAASSRPTSPPMPPARSSSGGEREMFQSLRVTWSLDQSHVPDEVARASTAAAAAASRHDEDEDDSNVGSLGGRHFESHGVFAAELSLVLRATVEFLPEFGYVQGVSYLASLLLNYLEPPQAFVALCNMLRGFAHLPAFYAVDHVKMSVVFNAFRELLAEAAPDLALALASAGVEPSMYVYNWLQTLYVRVLPLPLCIRLWDLILLDEAYVLRIAVALVIHFDLALRLGDPSVLECYDDDDDEANDAGDSALLAGGHVTTDAHRKAVEEERERRRRKKQSQREFAGLSPGMSQDSCLLILSRVSKYKVDAERLLEMIVMPDSSSSSSSKASSGPHKIPSLERIRACLQAHEKAAPPAPQQ